MSEDDYLESRKKRKGEIYEDYLKQKEDLRVGKRPKDILQDFIEQEMKEYINFRDGDALYYDAQVQKYTSQFLASKRKKAKLL